MATISTVAAGNWSNTATWAGGVLPGSGDVASVGHAVTLDQNISVTSLISTGTAGAVTSSTNRTVAISNALTMSLTTPLALLTVAAGTLTMTVGTAVTIGAHTGNSPAVLNVTGGSAHVTAPAWVGDSSATGTEPPSLLFGNGTSGTVFGDIIGGDTGAAPSLHLVGSAVVTVNGNVFGGSVNQGSRGVHASATSALTVNGNVRGVESTAVYGDSSAVITINGNVLASQGVGAGVSIVGSATVLVTGSVTSGAETGAGIIASGTGSSVSVRGNITGGTQAPAISSSRPVRVGLAGQTTVLSGYYDAINGPWVVAGGATVRVIRPDDSMFPLLTGTPIDHLVRDPYNPTIEDIAAVMGSLLAAALDTPT